MDLKFWQKALREAERELRRDHPHGAGRRREEADARKG
jgi:hypothetical protein